MTRSAQRKPQNPWRINIALVVLLFAQLVDSSSSVGQQADSEASNGPPVAPFEGDMYNWTTRAAAFVKDPQDFGIFLSSTQLNPVGRLLAFSPDSGKMKFSFSCSGTMVSQKNFLTAAHCFCKDGDFDDSSSCRADRSFTNTVYKVFIPTLGLFDVSALPQIHPQYSSPQKISPDKPLADLGVVTLSVDLPVIPAAVSDLVADRRHILAGFGRLTFPKSAEDRGFKPRVEYSAGAEQLSGQKPPNVDRGSCEDGAADTICTWYPALDASSGPNQSSAICPGDSGAPLLQIEGEKIAVIGLASYYFPKIEYCDLITPTKNYFIYVASYRDWLSSFISGRSGADPSKRPCIEGVIEGPFDTEFLFANAGVVTATHFYLRDSKPILAMTGDSGADCHQLEAVGLGVCTIKTGPARVTLSAGPGLVQISLCKQKGQ